MPVAPPKAEGAPPVIRAAMGAGDVAEARRLMRDYAASVTVDLCFQGFAAELDSLPGAYAPPRGGLLLAAAEGAAAVACVAFKPLPLQNAAEMKRLYVAPQARGQHLGQRLVEAVIADAKSIGYRRLYLDTLPEMAAAQRLYARLGFVETGAYVHNPVAGAKFFVLTLV